MIEPDPKPAKICEVKLILDKFKLDYPELAIHLKFQGSHSNQIVSYNAAGEPMNEAEDFWYQSQGGHFPNPSLNDRKVMPELGQPELPHHPEPGQLELPEGPDQNNLPDDPQPMDFNLNGNWSESEDSDDSDQYESDSDHGYQSASSDVNDPQLHVCEKCLQRLAMV